MENKRVLGISESCDYERLQDERKPWRHEWTYCDDHATAVSAPLRGRNDGGVTLTTKNDYIALPRVKRLARQRAGGGMDAASEPRATKPARAGRDCERWESSAACPPGVSDGLACHRRRRGKRCV